MDKLAAIMKELNSKYTITTERLAGVQTEDGYTPNLYYDLGNYVDSLKPNASMKDQFATQLKAVHTPWLSEPRNRPSGGKRRMRESEERRS